LQGKHASQTREKQTRAGDYRLIPDIQEAGITLLVLELGHRKDVYR
jgi:mRNA interferase RelE/StbE